MSKEFVEVLRFGSGHALALCGKFLDICPEEIWRKKAGGWPVGQQFYHMFKAASMFLASLGAADISHPDPKAGDLMADRDYCPSKEDAKKLYENVAAAITDIVNSFTDTDLLKNNADFSRKLGKDVNNAETLNLMTAHLLYHLGSCDAALRNEGLEGAF